MTSPPRRSRLFTGPMLGAVAVLAVLAVTVVIVALTRDGTSSTADPSQPADTSSAPPSYTPDPDFATSTGFGLAFDYPLKADGFDEAKWNEPEDGSIQGQVLEGLVRYPACEESGGSDLSMALMEAVGDDLDAATVSTMDTLAEITLEAGADYDTTDYDDSDITEYISSGGIEGRMLKATLTDPSPDACDTDEYELTSFVTDQPSGDLVALILVHRGNGDTAASSDELAAYAEQIIESLREE